MSDDVNIRESHGVRAAQFRDAGTYEGSVISYERDKLVRVALGSQQIDIEPEAALLLATMLRRCANRVIARRQPPK